METMNASVVEGAQLKELKEAFVSNLHGSTMLEIAALSAVVPAFIILRQIGGLLFESGCGNVDTSSQHAKEKKKEIGCGASRSGTLLLNDFIFVIVPTLACLTVLADWIYSITAVALCLAVVAVTVAVRSTPQTRGASLSQGEGVGTDSRKDFLSSFRFTMMLVTCVSILAVDFNVFPRRYAKTETYGTGLMDVGVGSFVVANGLVSRQARNLPPSKYGGVLRNTSPLLLIGFTRLVLTKGVDYQLHVAEYGVHWNFFFTLAAVALLTSVIHVPASKCGSLGIIILAAYQAILSYGLNKHLLSDERGPGLISLNKEGVYSIFGYWSLYLISVQLGHYFCNLPDISSCQGHEISSDVKRSIATRWWIIVDVWLLNAIFWLLTIFADEFIERVSRRMCNLAYVLFVLAQNLEVTAIFLTMDSLIPSKYQMRLLQIFDHNMLATFLWANILTGLVNMSMETIFATTPMALIALLGYILLLVGGMAMVEAYGVKVKFW